MAVNGIPSAAAQLQKIAQIDLQLDGQAVARAKLVNERMDKAAAAAFQNVINQERVAAQADKTALKVGKLINTTA